MPNNVGQMIKSGQSLSAKWPGLIDCGNGFFRQHRKTSTGITTNSYFFETSCTHCGKEFLCRKVVARREPKNRFCSTACKSSFVKNSHKGNKYAKVRPNGGHHVLVLQHDHHRANKRSGQVYEHILVAEEMLGRKLSKENVVHHINCVKSDNSPSNLVVCENQREHFLIHGSLNKCVAELIDMGVLIFDYIEKTYKVVK